MPVYLAYQFEPKQLTKRRVKRIVEDWGDFREHRGFNKVEDWFEYLDWCLEHPVHKKEFRNQTFLRKLSLMNYSRVKGYPLLLFGFNHLSPIEKAPKNFSGLHIKDCHTLQAIPEMRELHPLMGTYLKDELGIEYEDRSKLR